MNRATITMLKNEIPNCSETTLYRHLNHLIEEKMLFAIVENKTVYYQATERTKKIIPILASTQKLAYACDFPNSGYDSTIEYAKVLIGEKWKSRIIWALHTCGTMRFNELLRTIEGISHKVLQEQLEDLQQHGLLIKHLYDELPPRTEYTLTKAGNIAF